MRDQIRDVTLRDGLQLFDAPLPLSAQIDVVSRLRDIGVRVVEIGAMVRPDRVPAMALTESLIAALDRPTLSDSWVWVGNALGARKAFDAGAVNLQFCLSASAAHNRANVGRDVSTSLDDLEQATTLAVEYAGTVDLCIATAFTCPYEGPVDPDRVIALITDERAAGVDGIVVCDTLGQASPAEVSALVARVALSAGSRAVGFHGHDTWGMGLANSLAALAAGAHFVDGALAGLGGCPFAPGASGNCATEDLLFGIRPDWLTPRGLLAATDLAAEVLAAVGSRTRSKAAEGVESHAPRFPWARACIEAPARDRAS